MSHTPSQTRRTAIRILAVSSLALGVPAWAGGSSVERSTVGGSVNVDLYAAFELLEKGMTYEQVRVIVGSDYNNGKNDFGGGDIHYQWLVEKSPVDVSLLSVQFKNNSAVGKMVNGKSGNSSKFW